MYLFLGIFPYSRPVDQKQFAKITRLRFSTRKTRERKRRRSLLLLFSLSLSLAAERPRARERCTLPLCGGGGGGGSLCNNAFSREERRRVIKLFQLFQSKERFIQKGQGQGPPLV